MQSKAHFLQTPRTLEDLRVDGIRSGRLAAAPVASGLVEPVDLRFDLRLQFLESGLEFVGIDRRAVVLRDEGCCWTPIDGDCFPAFHEGGKCSAARAAEGVENEIPLRVVADYTGEGIMGSWTSSVHVVDRRRLVVVIDSSNAGVSHSFQYTPDELHKCRSSGSPNLRHLGIYATLLLDRPPHPPEMVFGTLIDISPSTFGYITIRFQTVSRQQQYMRF